MRPSLLGLFSLIPGPRGPAGPAGSNGARGRRGPTGPRGVDAVQPAATSAISGALSDPDTQFPQPWTGAVVAPAATVIVEWVVVLTRVGNVTGTAIAQSILLQLTVDGAPVAATLIALEPPLDGFARVYHVVAHLDDVEGKTVGALWGFGGAQPAATLTPQTSCMTARRRF